jgi:hypothetical protein
MGKVGIEGTAVLGKTEQKFAIANLNGIWNFLKRDMNLEENSLRENK